jgi:tetratricopeptide (TPR) repeat protein
MKMRLVPVSALCIFHLLAAAGAQEPNEKARRYYDTLLKRPVPGAVFDRFYNAWLDTATLEEMEKFLVRSANAADGDSAARMVLAFYYAKQNEHAKAAAEFARALERDPGSAEAWQQKAIAESKLLNFAAALASLEKALAANPAKPLQIQLIQFKGRLLARDGRTEEALKVWRELLADSPGDAALQEDIIELQTAEALNKEALATAQALLAQTTDAYQKVQRRLRIADLHARMGDRDAAIAACTECLDDTGADSWLEKEILAQIEQIFRRDDAVAALNAHFSALVQKHPQRLTLHRRYAYLQSEKGNVDGAVKTFENILKLAPGDRSIREDYINLLSTGKKTAEAVKQMEELIRVQPADAELPARLAELQFEAGNTAGVKAAVELFLTKSDQSEAALLRAAALLERCKQGEASLAQYRRAVEKFPASEGAHDALAVALHRNGQKNEAAAEWRKMAAGADKARLSNVARSAATRDEHELAWELLSARAGEFQNDPVFLTQLCDEASRLEKYSDGLTHAKKLVSLARDATSMEAALAIAIRMAQRAKKFETLLAELTKAESPQDRCLLAELLEKSGRRPEAEAALGKIAKEAPDLAASMRVRLFAGRGDDASAAQALQAMVEGPGGQKAAHVQRLVELWTRANKPEEALRWIAVWKKLSPGAPAPWQREADLHAEAGRNSEALKILRQASALFENNADLKTALAQAYFNEGKHADAMRLYTAMYEDAKDTPDKVRLAGELARTAQAADQMDALIESFEERRRGNRTSLAPLLSLAEIHEINGNAEARRTVLLEAARLAPGNADVRMEIIRNAEVDGQWDYAIQMMRDLAASDTTAGTQMKLVSLLFKAGRNQEAMQLMSGLAASGKIDARRAETIAISLTGARSWRECAEFLEPLITKYPADYRLAWLHAVALEESGNPSAALTAFRRLIAFPGDNSGAAVPPSVAKAAGRILTGRSALTVQLRDTLLRLCPEYGDILKFNAASTAAYSYKRVRATTVNSRNGATTRSTRYTAVSLPASVEDLRYMLIPHLRALTRDTDTRDEVVAEIETAGVRHTGFLMDMTSNISTTGSTRIPPVNLYTANPDHPAAQAYFASYVIFGSQTENAQIYELAGKLRDTRPELARLLAMSLAGSEERDHINLCLEATKEALALAGTDPAAKLAIWRLLIIRPTTVVTTPQGGRQTVPKMNPEVVEAIRSKLKTLYRTLDRSDPLRGAVFAAVADVFIAKKEYAELVTFLDEEMAIGPPPAASTSIPITSVAVRRLVMSSPADRIRSLGFPVRPGSDFPASITGVLDARTDILTGVVVSPQKGLSIPQTILGPLLSGAKDPVLRMLLASKTGTRKMMAEAGEALLALENPSFTASLLLAGWLESKDAMEEAAAVLMKAPAAATSADQWLLDGARVSAGLDAVQAAGGKADETSLVIKSAREAALRLLGAQIQFDARVQASLRNTSSTGARIAQIPLSSTSSQQMADALKTLGLNEDAKRYLALRPKAGAKNTPAPKGSPRRIQLPAPMPNATPLPKPSLLPAPRK